MGRGLGRGEAVKRWCSGVVGENSWVCRSTQHSTHPPTRGRPAYLPPTHRLATVSPTLLSGGRGVKVREGLVVRCLGWYYGTLMRRSEAPLRPQVRLVL
ncbi:hypothetical protein E2C01_081159 [Portunus trituberculatus]|uniref:Uncharacterized protein n=1 Tax=Portunus trituberculatus TaxID=210409 RepID=A0A5B7IX94_PORTR|nr:hypothetical protein [Portunus trituberculatus]